MSDLMSALEKKLKSLSTSKKDSSKEETTKEETKKEEKKSSRVVLRNSSNYKKDNATTFYVYLSTERMTQIMRKLDVENFLDCMSAPEVADFIQTALEQFLKIEKEETKAEKLDVTKLSSKEKAKLFDEMILKMQQ